MDQSSTGSAGVASPAMVTSPDRALDVLLVDYSARSEDHRQSAQLVAALLGVNAAVIAAVASLLIVDRSGDRSLTSILLGPPDPDPTWYLPLLPLAPFVILVLGTFASTRAVLLARYLEELEGAIRRLAPWPPSSSGAAVHFPKLHTMAASILSARTGLLPLRALWLSAFSVSTGAYLGLVVLALRSDDDPRITVPLGVFYALTAALLIAAHYRNFVRSAGLWRAAADRGLLRAKGESAQSASLAGYLLLPRPASLGKVFYLLVPAWVAMIATSRADSGDGLIEIVVFALLFEFGLYQIRYIVNDVHDLTEDGVHPCRLVRTRFPDPTRRRILGAVLIACPIRAVAAIAAGWFLLDRPMFVLLMGSAAIIALVAGPYSYLRFRNRIEPAPGLDLPSLLAARRPWAGALWLWVGAGHALRMAVGVWVGAGSAPSYEMLGLAAGAGFAFAWVTVTMMWAAEGGCFVPASTWSQRGVPRVASVVDGRILAKPHILLLTLQTGCLGPADRLRALPTVGQPAAGIAGLGRDRLLVDAPRNTVWNWAFCGANVLSAYFGLALANSLEMTVEPAVLVASAAGLAFSLAVVLAGPWWRASLVIGGVAYGILLTATAVRMDLAEPGVAWTPVAVYVLGYGLTRRGSYAEINGWWQLLLVRSRQTARMARRRLLTLVTGPRTFDRFFEDDPPG